LGVHENLTGFEDNVFVWGLEEQFSDVLGELLGCFALNYLLLLFIFLAVLLLFLLILLANLCLLISLCFILSLIIL